MDVVVTSFNQVDASSMRLPLITIYNKPKDYPDYYVARIFDLDKPTNVIMLCKSFKELRKKKPEDMRIFLRSENDDPCIIETWI